MGGCCCCASGGTSRTNPPPFAPSREFPPQPLQQGGPGTASAGRLVNTNLDTSIPDTFRAPPAPIPYDMVIGRPISPPVTQEVASDDKNGSGGAVGAPAAEVTDPGGDRDRDLDLDQDRDPSVKCEDVRESESKERTQLEAGAEMGSEVEISKPVKSGVVAIEEEEDVCPICLEDYDSENPKLITKCEHHFHLACVLEWMERSETCPNCDQEMVIDPPTNS